MLAKSATRRFSNSMPALLALATIAALALAGPLTPPAGPVAPTPGPEPRIAITATNTPGDNDSLFKITQPGSYYLTGNITGVTGKHGIEIVASGVTVDLNGFDLVGLTGMGAFDGVCVNVSNLSNIEVRNGSVRNWGDDGVDFRSTARTSIVRDVRSSGNADNGIVVGSSCTVIECLANDNGLFGIATSTGSTVTGCTASNNGNAGISTGNANTITGCTAISNGNGGIGTVSGSTITGCTASLNGAAGISAINGTTISGCTSYFNVGDGIAVTGQCVVIGNTCSSNGNGGNGAGILASGSDNRIENNNCSGGDRGIDVDGTGNIIIKNTCSGSTTNWTIVAGNHYGPIIDRSAVAAPPAVNGSAATEALGSTHPNANFTY